MTVFLHNKARVNLVEHMTSTFLAHSGLVRERKKDREREREREREGEGRLCAIDTIAYLARSYYMFLLFIRG